MVTNFQKRVYKILKKVPKGKITTYKKIAEKLRTSPRAVGNALNKNPYAPRIPCHRVIKTNGEVGGFASGTKNKIKLLKKEGIKILKGEIALKKYNFNLN